MTYDSGDEAPNDQRSRITPTNYAGPDSKEERLFHLDRCFVAAYAPGGNDPIFALVALAGREPCYEY